MYTIDASILVKATSKVVFSVIRNLNDFPRFVRDIKQVEVRASTKNETMSKWVIDIDGADVCWEERNIYDDKKLEMSFCSLKGDYNLYEGEWHVEPLDRKTRLKMKVNIDWNIPSFELVIGNILEEKSARIVRGMLAAIKRECERKRQI